MCHIRKFRFENLWLKEIECAEIISRSWESNIQRGIIVKIVDCGRDLMHWGLHLVNDFRGRIAANHTRIKFLKSRRDRAGLEEFLIACAYYATTLKQQEIYWQQRAKQFWLKDGDSNTKSFHAYASKRRQKNKIIKLQGPDGEWHYRYGDLGDFMQQYFKDLFTSTQGETASMIR